MAEYAGAADKSSGDAPDIVREARERYEAARDAEDHNRRTALDDIGFSRAGDQWPASIRAQREREGRPILTINKLPSFIRQVVNDSRQNKPSIKVRPADSNADVDTAEVIAGLIRNIEYISNADVAYDTAIECAVTGGFGYWRIVLDYCTDDAFELDLLIKRVSNPFSVYGDPDASSADGEDWECAFIVDRLSKAAFNGKYKGKSKVDWDDDAWTGLKGTDWRSDDDKQCLVAEYWKREKVDRQIVRMQDGTVVDKAHLEKPEVQAMLAAGVMQVHGERVAKAHKVTQRILTGLEELEKNEWPGRYIPIVPVYGDEFDIEGKRYFRGLIHNAIDAQRAFNYWRSAATELVALAPKVPFIGPRGAFDSDQDRWQTANTRSHPYLEYDGEVPPQRQPLDMGAAAGALQEAMNAADDIKATIGLFDASLGAKSNETSGKAIMARQREGDIATFHFLDNLSRAIRHTGRILIDLIPHVYTGQRVMRVLGEDGTERSVPINQQYQKQEDDEGKPLEQPIMAMHDLTSGKYDLTVTTGPSFTTRREEAVVAMTEMIRAYPPAAPIIGPELAKNMDWPGAEKIAEKMEQAASGQLPPEVQQMVEQGKEEIERLTMENMELKQGQEIEAAKLQQEQQAEMAKMELARQSEMAKLELTKQTEMAKLQMQMQLEQMKLQSAEEIEMLKIQSHERIEEAKTKAMAKAQAQRPAPSKSKEANS